LSIFFLHVHVFLIFGIIHFFTGTLEDILDIPDLLTSRKKKLLLDFS
jgi:hypothetical protein